MRYSDKNFQNLFTSIMIELIKNNVEVRVTQEKNSTYLGGFSLKPRKSIVCYTSTGLKSWFFALVHEYCHYKQHKEGRFDYETVCMLHEWVEKAVKPDNINVRIKKLQEIELDCEKRTLKILKDNKIKFDEDLYIKEANAAIFSILSLKNREYKIPYAGKMPNFFLKDYSKIPRSFL